MTMTPYAPAPNAESAQATLELALSLPLFLLLILGSAEIANLAWASVQLNNAARAGAAYASLNRANAASTTDICLAAQNEAPKFITSTCPSTQVSSTQICYCISGSTTTTDSGCTTTTLSTCPSPDLIQVAVQVNVSAPVTTLVHYAYLPASFTVQAQATVGVEQ
jgi:Flp pilus assembly protein TadG